MSDANRYQANRDPATPGRSGAWRVSGDAPRGRQGGQAILWFLATMAACCAALALVYNVGQVTNEKEKTINAADAAALSGALVEARVLNFEAYTNRAMIANEVTIAQLVSADSFVRYDATMAQYLQEYITPIPLVGQIFGPALEGYRGVMDTIQTELDGALPGLIFACNAAITMLEGTQGIANGAAPFAADEVASAVAEANMTTGRYDKPPELNPTLRALSFIKNTNQWVDFTKVNNLTSERVNARDVIWNSLDHFTRARGMGPFVSAINSLMQYSTGLPTWWLAYLGLDKTSGSTTLVNFDHWAAQDSLDVYLAYPRWCHFWFIKYPCGHDEVYLPPPIAYGHVDADTDGSVDGGLCRPNFSSPVPPFNCRYAVANAKVVRTRGIPYIRDLSVPGGPNTNPTLSFVAGVQKSADATLTTQRIGKPGMDVVQVPGPEGSPNIKDNLQNGDRLTSIATATVYFKRPDWNVRDISRGELPRLDHATEYASLYNPYWQARLATTDSETRMTYYAVIGSNPFLSALTP